MNKNHSQKLSDRQLDRLVRTILQSTIITDEEIEEIAESQQLRRNVLNGIGEEKSRRENRWFLGWHWQAATAGSVLFLLIAGAFVWFSSSPQTEIAAVADEKINFVLEDKFVASDVKAETTPSNSSEPQAETSATVRQKDLLVKAEKTLTEPVPRTKKNRAETTPQKITNAKIAGSSKTEIATEFIALSYLPASESGQVVRVKVPRSMLVSLGVSTNVERSKEMVNAEVIVGDDGAARAIRFLNE